MAADDRDRGMARINRDPFLNRERGGAALRQLLRCMLGSLAIKIFIAVLLNHITSVACPAFI